jgi:hypothetical protein
MQIFSREGVPCNGSVDPTQMHEEDCISHNPGVTEDYSHVDGFDLDSALN